MRSAPPASRRPRGVVAAARQPAYSADDRRVVAMLLLPFIMVAFAAGFSQSLRPGAGPLELSRAPSAAPPAKPALPPRVALAPSMDPPTLLPPAVLIPLSLPEIRSPAEVPIPAQIPAQILAMPEPPLSSTAPAPEFAAASSPAPAISGAQPPETEIAALLVPEPALAAPTPAAYSPAAPAEVASVCVAAPGGLAKASSSPAIASPRDPTEFGIALAAAAMSQTRDFVVYNDKYRRIAYPMGDVPSFYGVCTDVLIRAYRALSIDLQALVQQTRSGSGDPNIDHRRVDTLRRFFAAHGQSIPITAFAEDYRAGDIVSYWRPQNRHSRTHIAIVASEIGPSGRPMIIHNRGWGPQLEDGLFVDQITGHYRFTGLSASPAPEASQPRGAAKSVAVPLPVRRPGPGRAAALPANATH